MRSKYMEGETALNLPCLGGKMDPLICEVYVECVCVCLSESAWSVWVSVCP